jgi:uncharacterized damage-inducible protein DinB
MNGHQAAEHVRLEREYLMKIIGAFAPDQGKFCPVAGTMTVAQQINHIAFMIRWFVQGAFGTGFDLDPEKNNAAVRENIDLKEAVRRLNETYDDYIAFLETLTVAELDAHMPPNPILGEVPRITLLRAQADHTAHHRGVLTVYLRLLGIVPPMIYG